VKKGIYRRERGQETTLKRRESQGVNCVLGQGGGGLVGGGKAHTGTKNFWSKKNVRGKEREKGPSGGPRLRYLPVKK